MKRAATVNEGGTCGGTCKKTKVSDEEAPPAVDFSSLFYKGSCYLLFF